MSTNPFDRVGEQIDVALMNPNPKSVKTKDGPIYRVSFEIDQSTFINLMDAKKTQGMILAGRMIVTDANGNVPESAEKPKQVEKPYAEFWREVWRSGVFRRADDPSIYQALAGKNTDEEWREWVRGQKCVVSGDFDGWSEQTGESRNIYAHILRAEARPSGAKGLNSNKPVFSGIPLKTEYHDLQHSIGWTAVFQKYLEVRSPGGSADLPSVYDANEWAMTKCMALLAKWSKLKLQEIFEVESTAQIDPEAFVCWCDDNGVTLPPALRGCN